MYERRARIFFPEQECNLYSACMNLYYWKNCVTCTLECLKLLLIAMLITGQNN